MLFGFLTFTNAVQYASFRVKLDNLIAVLDHEKTQSSLNSLMNRFPEQLMILKIEKKPTDTS